MWDRRHPGTNWKVPVSLCELSQPGRVVSCGCGRSEEVNEPWLCMQLV